VHAEDKTIECWKHGSEFSLETGEALTLPATKAEPVYEVRVDGDDVVVVIE
jgi:3-phenylpropionate/trans-cinnamate dioxygenase ferredoxin subunit